MAAIQNVGKCFKTAKEFLDYLDDIQFGAWRPSYVVMHHTGAPNLKQWQSYGARKPPISDEQWMRNLAAYYGNERGWSAGPHFFFTPNNFCVLSPPTKRGVHAASFNGNSWGAECVGDFDAEPFTDGLRQRYAEGFAALYLALGKLPDPFQKGVSGLHFHRDDPLTNKTCPGRRVNRDEMIATIKQKMMEMGGAQSHDDDAPSPPVKETPRRTGTVVVSADDFLSIRDDASGKSPETGRLHRGDKVKIIAEARNGTTLWYKIENGDFVSAAYVKVD